ncbi:MAG TPA: cytochrome c oxidase subunit 3 [Acidimicrobiales bacterium]|nr:cytochrome c oxidase subunit 3 [Acidimicrobiales bacterium]HRA34747.1 cytochrome c oxidase subunit 3 [Acidimicrobiales bacterium]
MASAALALPPAAPPTRPRVLLVGTALASAATAMAFVGLIGYYAATRAAVVAEGTRWLPDGSTIPLTPGNMAFATMLISAVSVWWAVDAVGKNDRQMAYLALGLTFMFGVAVINATTFLYSQIALPVASTPGALMYTITGAHLAMIIVGLVFISVMVFRTLGGEYAGRDREGLVAAALFWFVTIAVHAVIWYAIYIVK